MQSLNHPEIELMIHESNMRERLGRTSAEGYRYYRKPPTIDFVSTIRELTASVLIVVATWIAPASSGTRQRGPLQGAPSPTALGIGKTVNTGD